MAAEIRLERIVDLTRSIVVDAFVDPVLVEGWLHPTARLIAVPDVPGVPGEVPREATVVIASRSAELGQMRIEIDEHPGGTRGAVTRVRITASDADGPLGEADLVAAWSTRLDQLEELLRGHPVDWENWERDYGAAYARHRAAALRETARQPQ